MCQVQKIDKWNNEHPNQIHEVPVEARDLQVIGVVATTFVTDSDSEQSEDSSDHMQKVQSCNGEEGSSEQGSAPWIVEQCRAFANQPEPLADVQERKNQP